MIVKLLVVGDRPFAERLTVGRPTDLLKHPRKARGVRSGGSSRHCPNASLRTSAPHALTLAAQHTEGAQRVQDAERRTDTDSASVVEVELTRERLRVTTWPDGGARVERLPHPTSARERRTEFGRVVTDASDGDTSFRAVPVRFSGATLLPIADCPLGVSASSCSADGSGCMYFHGLVDDRGALFARCSHG